MTFIEHWVDILGFLLVASGIGWLFHFLQKEGRSAERPISEKPALFLEFTGKQMFVRPQRSKLMPISRQNGETPFPDRKPSQAAPLIERLREDLVLIKMLYLATARDCLRALRLYLQRWRIGMKGAGRQMKVTNARLVTDGRARLAGIMRTFLDGDRGIRPNRRVPHRAVTGFQRVFDDMRSKLDIQGHRLDRAIQTQWKKCQVVTERWADALPPKSHLTWVRTKKLWNNLAGRVPVQIWWPKAKSVLTQSRDRLMAGYRTLQGAARGYIRRLEANTPGEEKSPMPARATGHTQPMVIGLTSSGTLKLRSRLEDEGVPQYEHAISELKGSRAVSNVTVRFVGTAQRHSRESAENKKAERMMKP